jgi:hypothetical protein
MPAAIIYRLTLEANIADSDKAATFDDDTGSSPTNP